MASGKRINAQFAKRFAKHLGKQPLRVQEKFAQRLALFLIDPTHSQLRNHPLSGTYEGFRSINITGDVRAIFRPMGGTIVRFEDIGTHSELYG